MTVLGMKLPPVAIRRLTAACAAWLPLVAGLVLAPSPALALDPTKLLGDCPIEVWRVRDGLPGGWVRGIVQSDDGYLWIGTFGGLTRFDGQRMSPIVSQDRFRRVSDVNDLELGPDGRLWVTPSFGGPVCLRGREMENCLPEIAPLQPNTRLMFTFRHGEALYLAGRTELYRNQAGKTELVVRYQDAPWKKIADMASGPDPRGGPWLATDTGLWVVHPPTPGPMFQRPPGTEALGERLDDAVTALLRTTKGGLVLGLQDALVHLSSAVGAQPAVRVEAAGQGYPGGVPSALLEDADGNLWIGTNEGLIRRTAAGNFHRFGKADGLPDEEITALHEDSERSLWVGMRAGGLAQVTDRSLDTRQGPPLLRQKSINTLTQDASGAFWFGTSSGLVRWKDGEARSLGTADGLVSAQVLSVRATADGAVWVGTDRGLQKLTGGKLEPAIHGAGAVVALAEDRARRLWVGGEGRVGRLLDGPDRRVQWLPNEPGHRWETVRAMADDDQGTLWVAAIGGLAKVENGRMKRVNTDSGIRLPSARSIYKDAEGTLWFGTNGGLLRRKQGRFHLFAAAHGLVAEQIYQVITDDVGYLWMGTGRGLFRVSRTELDEVAAARRLLVRPAWFDTSDERRDLAVTSVRQPGAWRALDGRLWFASDHGTVVVDPRRPHVNTRPPTIVIEEALVDGQAARPGEGTSNKFPAGHGNLEFRFAALTMVEPRKAQLRYRLEGFDPTWIDAAGRREARYIRVPAGRYRFRVQGSNADGVWNEQGALVELQIAPHFYKTGWFYLLCGLGALSVGWLLYRTRVDRLRRDYLAAFSERSRVARELHDTLLQSMAAVAMHLRGVRRKLEPISPPSSRELEGIENMVTLSLEETRRFVWNLREQPLGSGDLGRALGQLAERITAGRTPRAEVTVKGEVVPLPNNVQGDLFRIAQEAMANAVKHAEAQRIEVSLEYEPARTGSGAAEGQPDGGGFVRLRVADDGKGFDPATAQGASAGHFGLVGMRERASRLGTFTLDTRPGAGTRVIVTVPHAAQARPERQEAIR